MCRTFNTIFITPFMIFLLSGCLSKQSLNTKEFAYRESILLKANNQIGLINLYRESLKNKEDESVRLKLANAYYLSGDSQSSLYYLQPIAHKPNVAIYLLQIKNLINNGDNDHATTLLYRLLALAPNNPEVHNLKGIILASSGDTQGAHNAIIQSRQLFIQDDIARNNLAVIAMLDSRYQEAVKILLPDYLSGKNNRLMLHNLVFSLIKIGDTHYAKNIIEAERLSDNADELVLALSQVDSLRQVQ